MKVHAVRTGSVRVHERQRAGEGAGVLRFARTLLDSRWTEPLPIYAWVVEHPEGIIVVDTGETARTSEPGYFPRWHPYYRLGVEEDVGARDEIGPRLEALGIPPRDVRWVVMTHLHTDHAGGLHHFPDAEILVSSTEYAAARGAMGRLRGYLPQHWPEWFEPTLLELDESRRRPLPARGTALTRAGDVRVVPTPGHTAGHVSVLVDEGPRTLIMAGDTSYTEANLMTGVVDGVSSMGGGVDRAAATLEDLRRFAARRPSVYLPSHDPEAGRRLGERRVVDVSDARSERSRPEAAAIAGGA